MNDITDVELIGRLRELARARAERSTITRMHPETMSEWVAADRLEALLRERGDPRTTAEIEGSADAVASAAAILDKYTEALGRIAILTHRALAGGLPGYVSGLIWIRKACSDAGFNVGGDKPRETE